MKAQNSVQKKWWLSLDVLDVKFTTTHSLFGLLELAGLEETVPVQPFPTSQPRWPGRRLRSRRLGRAHRLHTKPNWDITSCQDSDIS